MNASRSRPNGITILGILAILVGLVGFVGGALLLMSADPLVAGLSAFAVLVGLLYLLTGFGFLQGVKWAWSLGLVCSILSLIRNGIEAATGGIIFAIPGLLVSIFIIAYLTRPEVKSYFKLGSAAGAPS